jgi:flagellar biosynthetic protein FliR
VDDGTAGWRETYLMHASLDPRLATAALIGARMTAFVLSAPCLSSAAVPLAWRCSLAAFLSVIAAMALGPEQAPPATDHGMLGALAHEAAVGCSLGLTVAWLLWGLQLGMHVVGQQVGLGWAEGREPPGEFGGAAWSRLTTLVAVAVFLVMGGHRVLIDALLGSFRWLPPGQHRAVSGCGMLVADLLTHSLAFGLQIVSPLAVAAMITMLGVAIASRSLPQLSHFTVGAGSGLLAMLAALWLSLGAMAWVFGRQLEPAVTRLLATWNALAGN